MKKVRKMCNFDYFSYCFLDKHGIFNVFSIFSKIVLFWIFVVTKNVQIIIFGWFLCKIRFFEFCPDSFLLKNQWKIEDFVIMKFQKLQKHYFFHGFLQKMKILTNSPLDGQKKKFSWMIQMIQKWCLRPFFDMTR